MLRRESLGFIDCAAPAGVAEGSLERIKSLTSYR